jgi:transcriptional regulator with XRE-family HTH domain
MAIRTAVDVAAQVQRLIGTGEARSLRQRAGITLQDAAAQCGGVHPSAVLRWEQGRPPRGRNLHAYARFLDRLAARETAA